MYIRLLAIFIIIGFSGNSFAESVEENILTETGYICSVELDDPDNMSELIVELKKAGCQRGDIIAFIRDRSDEWSLRMAARLCSFDKAVDTIGRWERCVYIGKPRMERNPEERTK